MSGSRIRRALLRSVLLAAALSLTPAHANGQHVEAVYEMVHEDGAWKINGVVAQPDPGEEA